MRATASVGANDQSTPACNDAAVLFYEQVISDVVAVSSTQTAEITKLLENTFRSRGPDISGRTLSAAKMLALASERLHEDTNLNEPNKARLFSCRRVRRWP